MRRCLLVLLMLGARLCFGQGLTEMNAANATNGSVVAASRAGFSNSWYGFRTGNNGSSGDAITSSNAVQIGTNNASNGALTVVTQASSLCGALPTTDAGGSQAKLVDYNTSVGGGTPQVLMSFELPSMSGTQVAWARDLTCVSQVFNTTGTFDDETLTGIGVSALSNMTNPGVSGKMAYNLEGTCGQNSWPAGDCKITFPVATWIRVWRYFQFKGACAGTITTITDAVNAGCTIIALTSPDNTTFYGFAYKSTGGTPGTACSAGCQPTGWEWGDINGAATSAAHVQHTDLEQCTSSASTTCTGAQFLQMILNPIPEWNGVLTYPRGADWTQSGFPGDAPRDTSWTQCGATIAAYTGNASTITTALAGCTANQYVLLGAGTFTLDGQILFPTTGNVVLRGSGANSTFLIHSGTSAAGCQGGGATAFICAISSDTTSFSSPANKCTVTGSPVQGATTLTLANLSGNCPASISTTTPTLLFLDGCNTNYSGTNCGTVAGGGNIDNGNWFVCSDIYSAGAGCSADGPDAGSRAERDELEIHTATAVNGSVYTIFPPILAGNWSALSNLQVWIVQPLVQAGIENLSLDTTNATAPNYGIEFSYCYHCWVTGVRTVKTKISAINMNGTTNSVFESNYIFQCTGTQPACYGIRQQLAGNNLIANNIIHQTTFINDGSSSGTVLAYNFIVGTSPNAAGNGLVAAMLEHAGDYYDYFEGNIGNQISCDDIHGTCDMVTGFRNFLTGWDSLPATPLNAFTNSLENFAFARYYNDIAGVYGTPGYHTHYKLTNGGATYVDNLGESPGGGPPVDNKTDSTSIYFGNYNSVTAATRFCGNALDTNWASAGNCNSVSEAPTGASIYPSGVPIYGDTAIGEDVFPASMVYTSKPAFFRASDPWPLIGPDISGGTIIQCAGTLNTVGKYNGAPALNAGQCAGSGSGTGWAGLVNPNPAMQCALSVMAIPPDGSGVGPAPFTCVYPLNPVVVGGAVGTNIGVGPNIGIH
jgi:hypothetical protein